MFREVTLERPVCILEEVSILYTVLFDQTHITSATPNLSSPTCFRVANFVLTPTRFEDAPIVILLERQVQQAMQDGMLLSYENGLIFSPVSFT
jgi:hypothetical protein